MDLTRFKSREDVVAAGDRVMPGRYHGVITNVDETRLGPKGKPMNAIRVRIAVLAGTVPSMVGKEHEEAFWDPEVADEAWKRESAEATRIALFLATGLLSERDLGKANVPDPDWQLLCGRQVCIDLIDSKGNSRISSRGKIGIYGVFDADAKEIPKSNNHVAMLRAANAGAAGAGAGAAGGTPQVAGTITPTPTAPAQNDEWSDVA